MAKDLSISVITTSRAYQELESEGFIATMQGKGSIILPQDSNMVKEQYLRKIEDSLLNAINYAKIADISEKELVEILKIYIGRVYDERTKGRKFKQIIRYI